MTAVACLLILGLHPARADDVTSGNTGGLLEALLLDETFAPVGTVEIWNTRMDMNIIVTPNPGFTLSKVSIYLAPEPPPPPVPDWLEPALNAAWAAA